MHGVKVLIVDDNEDSQVMLCALLEMQGYSTKSALNGKLALQVLSEWMPDLIITDIFMPEMDGFDLCRKVKDDPGLAHIPLVFYTATYTSGEDKELGLLLGATQFIIKPQEPDILVKLINKIIEENAAKESSQPEESIVPLEIINRKQLDIVRKKLQKKIDSLENEKAEKKEAGEPDDKLIQFASDFHHINESLSDFSFIAAHDLIEPLRKISSFSSRLKDIYGEDLDERQQNYLSVIEKSSLKMKRYIDDLAHFAQNAKTELNFEDIDIQEIFAKVLESYSSQMNNSKAQVSIESSDTLVSDKLQLKELFGNIISNSFYFKKENSPPTIHVSSQKTGDGFLEVKVEDSGVGFDEKYADKIFKPFQRLQGHHHDERSGMGLAVCKVIVERLGGNITAKSSPDNGATFTVRLPLEPEGIK